MSKQSKHTVFGMNQFEDQYRALLSLQDDLHAKYWALHKEIAETSYPVGGAQMNDAVRLGKLAAAVDAIRQARNVLSEV